MASKIRVSLIIDSESDDLLFEYLSQFPLKRRANFLRELATNDLRNRIEPWKPKTSNKTEKEIDDKVEISNQELDSTLSTGKIIKDNIDSNPVTDAARKKAERGLGELFF